jgi:cytochrome c6
MRYPMTTALRRDAASERAVRCALGALLLFAACGLAGPGMPPANAAQASPAAADTKAGEAIFSTNCAVCHPEGGNVVDPAKPVRGSAKLKDFPTFLGWIRVPNSPMTPFSAAQIPEAQARELYRYVVETLTTPAAK